VDLSKSYDYFKPETVEERIHIVGCGSVGSTLAENLARVGLTKFTLWDFDEVEPHNIVNQMFTQEHIGKPKVEALREIVLSINPEAAADIQIEPKGWRGKMMSGYIFLAVDNIELRKKIVERHMDSPYVKAVFDFRTLLESGQHYAADWTDSKMKKILLDTMQFTHEEAKAEEPVSACGVVLGVNTTVRLICGMGVNNFLNFVRGQGLWKMVNFDGFHGILDCF
jgi:hypothetical protein